MFDFDAGKLLVIGLVALIVIGPKDLPKVLRQLGQTVAHLRRMASEFQSQFMEAMREAELDDIRQDVAKLGEQTKIGSIFNPLETVRREISDAMADRRTEPEAGAPALDLEGLKGASEGMQLDFAAAAAAPIAQDAAVAAERESAPAADLAKPPPSGGMARESTIERAADHGEASVSHNLSGL